VDRRLEAGRKVGAGAPREPEGSTLIAEVLKAGD
jgi:hypothetical protein